MSPSRPRSSSSRLLFKYSELHLLCVLISFIVGHPIHVTKMNHCPLWPIQSWQRLIKRWHSFFAIQRFLMILLSPLGRAYACLCEWLCVCGCVQFLYTVCTPISFLATIQDGKVDYSRYRVSSQSKGEKLEKKSEGVRGNARCNGEAD
jgi:hypothetical protein